jgi:putative membrane protein insertion efficiency factor
MPRTLRAFALACWHGRGPFALVLVTFFLLIVPKAQALALGGIHVYQHTLAPLADRAGARCRFTPTCSRYSEAVIARDGVMRGGWKAVKRIARCGPWTRAGTRDEP